MLQGELGKVTEQLATLVANGAIIMAKTDNSAEKDLVASTTSNLSEQLGQLNLLIEEKKNKANDALDAWQKFLTMAAGTIHFYSFRGKANNFIFHYEENACTSNTII